MTERRISRRRRPSPMMVAIEDQILAALRPRHPSASALFLSTVEVSGRVSSTPHDLRVYRCLTKLAERGEVVKTTLPGQRQVYWSRPPEGLIP